MSNPRRCLDISRGVRDQEAVRRLVIAEIRTRLNGRRFDRGLMDSEWHRDVRWCVVEEWTRGSSQRWVCGKCRSVCGWQLVFLQPTLTGIEIAREIRKPLLV